MGKPVAKKDDKVVGLDTHIEMISSPAGPVPTPMPHPFSGPLGRDLASSVFVDGKAAATVGSGADNQPSHIPNAGSFQSSPSNKATVKSGSSVVFAGGKAIARSGDSAECCNDPSDQETGHIVASGTCLSG